MPNLLRHEISKYPPSFEASLAYGDEFLIDTLPIGQPYIGAWGLTPELQQKYPVGAWHKYSFCNTPAVNKENVEVFISEWPENKDPFTQVDLLDNEEVQLQELLLRLKTSLSIPYRESLANRLISLLNVAKEEESASPGINVSSLHNFLKFLQLHSNLRCPTISLTPEQNIYATWRGEKKRVFSVHFLSNEDVRYVIFKHNDKHPEKLMRDSEIATNDILMEAIASYGVWDWVSE